MLSDFATRGSKSLDKLNTTPHLRIQTEQGSFQKSSEKSFSRLKTRSSSQVSRSQGYLFAQPSQSQLNLIVKPLGGQASIRNSFDTAQKLGNLSGKSKVTWSDSVDSGNTNDFFQFSLSRKTKIKLLLSGLSGNADLQLLRANGSTVKRSARGNLSEESMNGSLKAGTYYVRVVNNNSAGAKYTLSLNTSGTAKDAGNQIDSAVDAGNLTRVQRTYGGSMGGSDTNDYFQFDLSRDSTVNLALNAANGNISLRILDSNGNAVTQPTSSRSLSQRLRAGSYYAQLTSNSSSKSGYVLDMSANLTGSTSSGGYGSGGYGSGGYGSGGNGSGGYGSGGNSGGSSSNKPPTTTGDRSLIWITRTNQRDSSGLVKLNVALVQGNKVVDQVAAVAGQPGKQYFRTGDQSRSGSMEPLPEGYWNLGTVEWASGRKGDYSRSWSDRNDGLGPVWVPMTPTFSTQRSEIGFHFDNNADRGMPGTVGCVGLTSKSDLRRFVSWFDDSQAPKTAAVDWGLGTLRA